MNEFLNGITLGKVMKGIVRMFLRLFEKVADFFKTNFGLENCLNCEE
jgi:hypothetical protein